MKMSIKYAGTLALLPTVAVVLAACGGSKVQGTESVAVAAAPGGGAIVVETFTSTATVSALNTKDRKVTLEFPDGKKTTFPVTCRIDTPNEVDYYQHGGILQYVLRQMAK